MPPLRPAPQRLYHPIILPAFPLLHATQKRLNEFDLNSGFRFNDITLEVTRAGLEQFLVDAEGHAWSKIFDSLYKCSSLSLHMQHEQEDLILSDLLGTFHRLLNDTVGTLQPSYVYQCALDREELILRATVPGPEYHAERIRAMANPDEGWLPARYRERQYV